MEYPSDDEQADLAAINEPAPGRPAPTPAFA